MKNNPATSADHNAALDAATKLTMLVVDDSKVIRLALNKILKTDYNVLQANDGEEAWTVLSENEQISAVFSDVSMPILDGFGLLERVRSSTEDRIANIPFIIITANEDDETFVNKVNQAGGTDLVTKPFKTNEIMQCLTSHVLTEGEAASPMSEYQDSGVSESLLNTQEVSSLLGLDDEIEAPVQQQTNKAEEPCVKENAALLKDSDTAEGAPVSNVILEDSAAFSMSEDLYEPTQVEFTIDEDFFSQLDNVEEADDSLPEEHIEASVSPETAVVEDELTLEPILESVTATPMAEITDSAIDVPPDVFTSIELNNRSAFNEIDGLTDHALSDSDRAKQISETNQIRAELLRLREQEINKGTYSQDHDFSMAGKIAFFFKRIKRIISSALGINRKN